MREVLTRRLKRSGLATAPHPPSETEGGRREAEEGSAPLPSSVFRLPPGECRSLADRWIVSRLNHLIAAATRLIEDYQFGEAGRQIYEFFWGEYCDWYLEIAKIQLRAADERGDRAARTATLGTLTSVLDCALRLLHPYVPFVTEEIYQQIPGPGGALIIAPWPEPAARDEAAERDMGVVTELVGGIRTARAELNIEPRRKLPAIVVAPAHLTRVPLIRRAERHRPYSCECPATPAGPAEPSHP